MACSTGPSLVGSILYVTSTTRPSGSQLYTGQRIFELDTGRELMHDGTGWVIMSEPTVSSFVPVVTSGTGSFTSASATMRYYRANGWLYFGMRVTCTTVGTAASFVNCSMPVAAIGADDGTCFGRNPASGNMIQGTFATGPFNVVSILTYNNLFPITSGQTMDLKGFYQMTTRYS